MDINEAVSLAVRRRMIVTGDTYRSLSAASSIPERTLARLLGNEREITMNRLKALADALDCDPTDLIEDALGLMGN